MGSDYNQTLRPKYYSKISINGGPYFHYYNTNTNKDKNLITRVK